MNAIWNKLVFPKAIHDMKIPEMLLIVSKSVLINFDIRIEGFF
jgi:hypothetical protein